MNSAPLITLNYDQDPNRNSTLAGRDLFLGLGVRLWLIGLGSCSVLALIQQGVPTDRRLKLLLLGPFIVGLMFLPFFVYQLATDYRRKKLLGAKYGLHGRVGSDAIQRRTLSVLGAPEGFEKTVEAALAKIAPNIEIVRADTNCVEAKRRGEKEPRVVLDPRAWRIACAMERTGSEMVLNVSSTQERAGYRWFQPLGLDWGGSIQNVEEFRIQLMKSLAEQNAAHDARKSAARV